MWNNQIVSIFEDTPSCKLMYNSYILMERRACCTCKLKKRYIWNCELNRFLVSFPTWPNLELIAITCFTCNVLCCYQICIRCMDISATHYHSSVHVRRSDCIPGTGGHRCFSLPRISVGTIYTRPNIPSCWKVSGLVSHSSVARTESRREWK